MHSQDILFPLYWEFNLACGLFSATTKYKTAEGIFQKYGQALTNSEQHYDSVRLKQLKPEVLLKSFHLFRMEMKRIKWRQEGTETRSDELRGRPIWPSWSINHLEKCDLTCSTPKSGVDYLPIMCRPMCRRRSSTCLPTVTTCGSTLHCFWAHLPARLGHTHTLYFTPKSLNLLWMWEQCKNRRCKACWRWKEENFNLCDNGVFCSW